LAQELATLAQFTAAANHATHPVLRQRAAMLSDMRDLGITGFAQKYADQAAFVETVKRRSGDLLRQERDNPHTYHIFATASARLQAQGTLRDDPIANRFLSLYSEAVRQRIVPAVSGRAVVQSGPSGAA
ncbi:MAG: hypothetical protein C0508_21535, partial [Cyanobacteria bacterium PR.023]|nr:hypothetical protein [Cyanobacteria bacterium PR.023]